jgi:hypothetical protein
MNGFVAIGTRWRGLILALVLIAPLTACTTNGLRNVAGPPPAFAVDTDIEAFSAHYASKTSVADYYKTPETRLKRDEFVVGRLTLYNLQYIKFIQGFAIDRAQSQAAFDITNLAFGVANSLVGGEADHAALTAATTLLNGSRTAIDKNFFAEQTVPALVTQMNASRQVALVPILRGLQQDERDYPLSEALVDLQKYYEAGTIQGALMDVQVAAGAKKAVADRQIEQLRSVRYVEDAASVRIRAWIWPTGVSFSRTGAVDAAGAAASANATSLAALRGWMANNGWQDMPVQQLINGETLADARKEAVEALSIPAPK